MCTFKAIIYYWLYLWCKVKHGTPIIMRNTISHWVKVYYTIYSIHGIHIFQWLTFIVRINVASMALHMLEIKKQMSYISVKHITKKHYHVNWIIILWTYCLLYYARVNTEHYILYYISKNLQYENSN